MAFRSPNAAEHNPLRACPSALALVGGQMPPSTEPPSAAALAGWLRLDPLAVLRALRFVHAPVQRQLSSAPTAAGLVDALGSTAAARLLMVDAAPAPLDSPLRAQWLHAIATAAAAELLARRSGTLDPEAAWLLGLLCDTPRWLSLLQAHLGMRQAPSAADCAAQWQLPLSVVAHFQSARYIAPGGDELLPTDTPSLLRQARWHAMAAGFTPGLLPGSAVLPVLSPGSSDWDRLLRDVVAPILAAAERRAVPEAQASTPAIPRPLEAPESGLLDLLDGGVTSHRAIADALAAAGVRSGHWDRAAVAGWNADTGTITLRALCTGGSLALAQRQVQVSVSEAHALRETFATARPTLLQAALRDTTGLLAALSTDELLAVPLGSAIELPSLLLLDCGLTLRQASGSAARAHAAVLGAIGTLRFENLLLRKRSQRSQRYALTDPLTHLFNRRMGLLALEREVAACDRTGRSLAVLMADLDHFKQLNDSHGHLRGDQALRATAEVLRATMRKGDTVCRFGGEEFVMVLPDTTAEEAALVAARLFTAVQRRGEEAGLPITISIGLTTWRPGDTVEAILHRADHALYASKDHGRNRFSADVDADGATVLTLPSADSGSRSPA